MTRVVRAGLAVVVVVLAAAGLAACEVPTPLGTVHVYADSPSGPGALAVTPDGSVWFANTGNGTIGRRSLDGKISTFPAPKVQSPLALTVGPDGNVWFTDRLTSLIGRVTTAGEISTFPSGLPGGGLGVNARDITTGPDGNLWYVGLSGVAKRTSAGVVTVYPGSDVLPGYPLEIASGPDGNLWYTTNEGQFATRNRTIVRITTQGEATAFTVPGLHPGDITAGPDGNLWFTNDDSIGRITTAGAITLFHDSAISSPTAIAAGPDGNLWFVGADRAIGRITTSGVATRFPDPGIVAPRGITATSDGLWFTDASGALGADTGGAIKHITTTGIITLASPGTHEPDAITKGSDGGVWFANFEGTEKNGIGRIAPDGTTQVFRSTGVLYPRGIAPGTDGSAWFTNENLNTIGRVSRTGTFTYFTDPSIQHPRGITRGSDGNLWFTNHDGASIGRITPEGAVTGYPTGTFFGLDDITTASDGGMWFDNDGSAWVGRIVPTGAIRKFALPYPPTYISAVGPDLWFTVTSEDLIGKITPDGVVTTYTDPLIDSPGVLAGDAAGNIYFGNGNGYYPNGFGTGLSIGRRTPGGVVTLYPRNTSLTDMVGGRGDIWFTSGQANRVTRFGTKT